MNGSKSNLPLVSCCIFCQKIPLSEEHLWPSWLEEEFDFAGIGHIQSGLKLSPLSSNTVVIEPHIKRLQKSAHRKTLKIVCESCNNTWMSGIEESAKKTLQALISGKDIELCSEKQKLIAIWATLKTIVFEYTKLEAITVPLSDLQYLKNNLATPPNWRVWLGWYEGDEIKNSVSYSHSNMKLKIDEVVSVREEKYNTQVTTLVIGKLVIHTYSSSVISPENFMDSSYPIHMFRIWPVNNFNYRHIGIPAVSDENLRIIKHGMINLVCQNLSPA